MSTSPLSDIENLDHIKVLVDTFYGEVRKDDLIGPIFERIIQDRWPEHLQKMYTFWQTVLLKEHTYYGSPFRPHATLPLTAEHFDHWKSIFNSVIDKLYQGPVADEAKWRAERMADMFLHKISYIQNHPTRNIL